MWTFIVIWTACSFVSLPCPDQKRNDAYFPEDYMGIRWACAAGHGDWECDEEKKAFANKGEAVEFMENYEKSRISLNYCRDFELDSVRIDTLIYRDEVPLEIVIDYIGLNYSTENVFLVGIDRDSLKSLFAKKDSMVLVEWTKHYEDSSIDTSYISPRQYSFHDFWYPMCTQPYDKLIVDGKFHEPIRHLRHEIRLVNIENMMSKKPEEQ